LRHQAGDVVNITAQPIELSHDDRRLMLLRQCEGSGQLWALVERVRTFAGLNLLEGLDQVKTFSLGEPSKRGLLSLEAKTGTALLRS
jgi:hypothetical protein